MAAACDPLILSHAGGLPDVPDVEEVVRDAAALGRGQLRGADVHAAVQLHGVRIHHLAADLAGQVHRQVGTFRPQSARRPR